MSSKHLIIVLPAYNEARVISQVLGSLPKKLRGVGKITPLVIDDNSSDNTRAMAESCGAVCLRHSVNLGAGGATITGLEAARSMNADIVVTMDSDGQHDPNDLQSLVDPIVEKEVDVVLGSRMKQVSKAMPSHKVWGNNVLNGITYLFFRIWVSDSQSGYKAFSRRAIESIQISTCGYEICSEMIGEIKRHKLAFTEVPISTIYTDYSKSKCQLSLNAVNIVLGLLLRQLRNSR